MSTTTLLPSLGQTTLTPPAQADALRKLGHTAMEQGNVVEAVDLFTRWTHIAPGDAGSFLALATGLLKLKRQNDAVIALETATRIAPADLRIRKLITSLLVSQGRWSEAVTHLRAALVASPGNIDLLAQLTQALISSGDGTGAMDCVVQMFVKTSKEPSLLQAFETLANHIQRPDLAELARSTLASLQRKAGPVGLGVVNVEITTFCNLKCTGCTRTVGVTGGTWANRHLTIPEFQKIVDELPPTELFVPYGIGEPMLHPEIFEIIRIAKSATKFKQVMLTSNATARKLEDFDKLFEIGLDRLCVSVDSLDPVLIDEVRPGTDVVKLKSRLEYLANRYPGRLEIRSVVGKNNLHALPELLATLNGIGKMDAYFQPYDDVGNPAGCMNQTELKSAIRALEEGARKFPNLRIIPQNFIPSTGFCSMPWSSPFITANGDVTPCCRVVNPKVATFGNALKTPFQELWNSAETNDWRAKFKAKSHDMCKGCPMFVYRG